MKQKRRPNRDAFSNLIKNLLFSLAIQDGNNITD